MVMRKMVLELSRDSICEIIGERPFQNIRSMELIYFLRHDKEEMAGIFRVEFEKYAPTADDLLLNRDILEAQILEREKDGKCIVFVKGRPGTGSSALSIVEAGGGYLLSHFEIREEKIRLTFFGSQKQVAQFLEQIQQKGLHAKMVLLTEAKFSLDSPLSVLTEKQKNVLIHCV